MAERLDIPANAPRLAYTRGVCEAALSNRDRSALANAQGEAIFLGNHSAEAHAQACGLKPRLKQLSGAMEEDAEPAVPAGRVDWASMPASLDPARGEVGAGGIIGGGKEGAAERAERKRWQVESVYCALLSIVDALVPPQSTKDNGASGGARSKLLRVVDFGSGSGNATLAIAWLLRTRCSFVLLDMKPVAVQLAETRVAAVPGLEKTVQAIAGRIEDYRCVGPQPHMVHLRVRISSDSFSDVVDVGHIGKILISE